MGLFDPFTEGLLGAVDNVKNVADRTRRDFDQFRKETKPEIDLNPFDDNKLNLRFGGDKQPIDLGISIETEKDPYFRIPLPKIDATARFGGWGLGGNVSIRPQDLTRMAKGKLPFDIDVIVPSPSNPGEAAKDPNFRIRSGFISGLKGLVDDLILAPKAFNPTIEDIQEKLRKEAKDKPIGGFTVPKGVLGADQGIYAAILNGKQGFLDKATGKWSEYGSLSPEQKARLASDFINDPTQLAKALPQGSYSKKDLYLPEFQKVQSPQ